MFPDQAGMLGLIVIATGMGAAFGSPFWGRFAVLSSRKVLLNGEVMGSAAGFAALTIGFLQPSSQSYYLLVVVILILGISEAGAGRDAKPT